MFDHIHLLRLRECREKLWSIRISAFPHSEKESRESAVRDVEKIGRTGKATRKSAFEVVDDMSRVRMIGFEFQTHGSSWLKSHPRQVKWLESQGWTLQQAAEEANRWWNEKMQDAELEKSAGRVTKVGGFGRSAGEVQQVNPEG